jgi:hypothetical protein
MAIWYGLFTLPAAYPLAPERTVPEFENFTTLPPAEVLATQAFPLSSTAMERGSIRPPPVKPLGPERTVPELDSFVMLLLDPTIQAAP